MPPSECVTSASAHTTTWPKAEILLQHYVNEVTPVLRQLPPGLFGWISKILDDNETDFDAMHPIVPNGLPNYLKGLQGELRSGTPSHLTELDTLGFMVRSISNDSSSLMSEVLTFGLTDVWLGRWRSVPIRGGFAPLLTHYTHSGHAAELNIPYYVSLPGHPSQSLLETNGTSPLAAFPTKCRLRDCIRCQRRLPGTVTYYFLPPYT